MALEHMCVFCPKCKLHMSIFEPYKLEDDIQYFHIVIQYLHDYHFDHGYWFGTLDDNYKIYEDDSYKQWRNGFGKEFDVMLKEYKERVDSNYKKSRMCKACGKYSYDKYYITICPVCNHCNHWTMYGSDHRCKCGKAHHWWGSGWRILKDDEIDMNRVKD